MRPMKTGQGSEDLCKTGSRHGFVLNSVKPKLIDVTGEAWTCLKAAVLADSGVNDAQITSVQMESCSREWEQCSCGGVRLWREFFSQITHEAESDSGFVQAKGFRYLDWWRDESLFPLHA